MAPAFVQKKNENRLWVRLYGGNNTYLKPFIPQEVMVRVSGNKTIFDKGYMPNWRKKHFTVSQEVPVKTGTKRHVYKLMDYNE